ncbi:M15 family metallopeptidase [Zhouia sp. PK063]|uniref:M15 family metallopeptidase n=1 Tax=Zhouia sp. PK063 TaxID=3373602 RepID=UPI0037AA4BF2
MKNTLLIFFCIMSIVSCKNNTSTTKKDEIAITKSSPIEQKSKIDTVKENKLPSLTELTDTSFVRLRDYSKNFVYDLRYATKNNFLKTKVYDCAECYVRVKTAKALLKANAAFMKHGLRIKFFDCYRPHDVQYKMWKIVPNSQYVANPDKGSVHNRGGAVDITLVDSEGKELDMGTGFDYFGKKAYHDCYDLPQQVLANRKLLKETMNNYGFDSIRTEWWHYNLRAAYHDKVANFKWPCSNKQ